ncbi:MAG TPA: fumarylacetoacetate hydrolase family protein [Alphaproteobacteria bacterium]|nr:fumarylacetoacetate hydrolase family protein [Alphaproteobacteria bacterium]
MKLVRYGEPGRERPGMVDAKGALHDLADHVADIDGAALVPEALELLRGLDSGRLPLVHGRHRLGAPIGKVGKVIAVGLNYADHAAEAGLPIPEEPVVFMKATSAISGPHDEVILPRGSKKCDWEVELAIVIGKEARYVPEEAAAEHIAGFTICNDVTDRHFQFERSGQWVKGKSADTFCPLGPWLVTADEIGDPQALDLWLEVNGERVQNGSTRTMIFGVNRIVSYISQFMSLQPGDVIPTGTPPGVGMGHKPQRWLKAGDEMRLGISGLGEQRQRVKAWEETISSS